jgi:octaprenyl-diphosphate synthase
VETSEDRYLEIISAKTAALFAAACKVSAVVAEREEQVEWALKATGRNLGIAFQLVDDAIDYAEDSATMGKDQGDDFRDGKVTLPVILAFARGDAAERNFWREAMGGQRVSDDDLARRGGCWGTTDAIGDTLQRRAALRAAGRSTRSAPSPRRAKAAMVEAVEFAVSRAILSACFSWMLQGEGPYRAGTRFSPKLLLYECSRRRSPDSQLVLARGEVEGPVRKIQWEG